MVNKKRTKHVLRPWCWYCERDFEDEKVLMQHQKAKHFKCGHCPRKLNTAGGLAVHIQQVHKLDPEPIENAIVGRTGYDVEIFGMEGIPAADVATYKRKKEQELGLPVGYFGNKASDPGKPNQTKRNYENRVYTFEELTSLLETHKQLMGREDENANKMETEASGPVLHAAPQTYNLPPSMSGIPSLPGLPNLPNLTTIPSLPGLPGMPGGPPLPGMPGAPPGLPGMPPLSMTGPPGAPPLALPFPPLPGMPFPPFPPGMLPPGGFPGLPPPSALAKAGEGATPTPPPGAGGPNAELPKGFPGLPGMPPFGMPPGFGGPNGPGGAGGPNIPGLPGIPGLPPMPGGPPPPLVSKLPTGISAASTSPSKKPMMAMGSRPGNVNVPNAPAAPFDPVAAGLKEGTILKWTDMNYSPLERRAEDPKYSQPSGTASDGDVDMADATSGGRKRAKAEDFLD